MNISTIPLGIDNCYLLEGATYVFIDGGAPKQSQAFVKRMAALRIPPSKVGLIILTHAHWDHIGSVHALVELTGAKLAVHKRERAIVERGLKSMPPGVTLWGAIFGAILRAFLPFITIPPAHVDIEIGDDGLSLEPYGIRGRVVHTPGHSPGSVSIVLDSGDVFVGDLAMNSLPLTYGPDLPIFAEDIGTVKQSWRKLLKLGVVTIFPAHGKPFPASVMERRLATAERKPAKKRILPPVYLLVSIVGMIALRWLLPGRRVISYPWTLLGIVPALAGVVLNLVADAAFKRSQATVKPFEESRSLITGGVYGISRNPMYLGFTLILLGIAVFMGATTPFAVLLFFLVLIEAVFIRVEERMLEAKFGEAWLSYKARVRRWI